MKEQELNFILQILQGERPDARGIDFYTVMGALELNRVSVPFYNLACKNEIPLPQSVKRKLLNIKQNQCIKNKIQRHWITTLNKDFESLNIKFAFLKGSILNYDETLFCEGERTSNDIDILTESKNISKISSVLLKHGFKQGYFDFAKERFVEFGRHEIISRRMNRGETAPFILEVNDSMQKFVEVDINFSLDYLPCDENVVLFLDNTKKSNEIQSLSETTFFLHLILHQYKEIKLLSMVKRNKDAELYKYYDLYKIINKGAINFYELYKFCTDLAFQKECYLVLRNTMEIFSTLNQNNGLNNFFNKIKPQNMDYLNEIIDPEVTTKYIWKISLKERLRNFFTLDMIETEHTV